MEMKKKEKKNFLGIIEKKKQYNFNNKKKLKKGRNI